MKTDCLRSGDLVSVNNLEAEYQDSFIGKEFKHNTAVYGEDKLTIKSKSKGFGILFFSDKFQKEFYLYSNVLLRVI